MTITRQFLIVAAALLLAAGLSACREHEQGRPLVYEKGVYGGQPQESLGEERRRQLQQRAASQYN